MSSDSLSDPGSEPKPRGMSLLAKVLVFGTIALILVVGGAGYGIYKYSVNTISDYEDMGFVLQPSDSALLIDETVSTRNLYSANTTTVSGHVTTDIALFVQKCTVTGTIDGNLHFCGYRLIIDNGAHVKGDVIVRSGNAIEIEAGATIDGKVQGNYARLEDRRTSDEKGDSPAGK